MIIFKITEYFKDYNLYELIAAFRDGLGNGERKVFKTANISMCQLRNDSVELTERNVINMIKHYNWYESSHNKRGGIYLYVYEKQKLNKNVVILDKSTGLMWQKGDLLKRWIIARLRNI